MKNQYQEALTALLSGLTTMKNKKEIWWKDKCGVKVTYEGLGGGRYVERRYTYTGNIHWEEKYKDGQLNGISKIYDSDGNIHWEREYKNGKLNGVSKHYHPNGSVKWEGKYKNGKSTGAVK